MQPKPNGAPQPVPLWDLLKSLEDGMRTAHGVIRAALDDNHPSHVGHRDTTDALAKGEAAADAYEDLTRRLEAEDDTP